MKRILVVEDDLSIQAVLHDFLEDAGYGVTLASDGAEALKEASARPFDLILLDIMLPRIDGYGVCRAIRQKSYVPIIMLTALDDEQNQMKGLDLQADDYITKPFSMPVLIRKIAAVLRRSAKQKEVLKTVTYKDLVSSRMKEMADILAAQTEDEFVFHIFQASGREVELFSFHIATGRQLKDFEEIEKTDSYPFVLYDSEEEYILFASQNTDKESQIVEALQKSVPVLSVFIFILSATASFFYAGYMTKPIRKISNLSRQMAELDFGGRCPTGRTDEIGLGLYIVKTILDLHGGKAEVSNTDRGVVVRVWFAD